MPKSSSGRIQTRSKSIVTDGVIDRSNGEHIDYLNDQMHIFSAARDYFVTETNETERALCSQLMLIDTVLLTGTLVAVANSEILSVMTDAVKLLTIFAITFLLISIGAGIRYYFKIISYDKRWAFAKNNAMRAFLDSSIMTWLQMRVTTDGYQINIPQEQDNFWLRLQILFIAAAALFYLVALFGLLFNVGDLVLQFTPWLS